MKIIVISFLCLTVFCSFAYGADFISYNGTEILKVYESVDGANYGLCQANDNDNTIGKVIHATNGEVTSAKTLYQKIDILKPTGQRVIPMKQSEIDAIILAEAQAQKQAKIDAINNLDITSKETVQTIINLGILNETTFKTQLKSDSGLTP